MSEQRRYRSDDRDVRGRDNDFIMSQGGNGDWYLTIVPHGQKIGPTVRITTSGIADRFVNVPAALVNLYRALGGEAAEPEVDDAPNICPGCYALPGEEHASFCMDKAIEDAREREAELRDLYPEDYRAPTRPTWTARTDHGERVHDKPRTDQYALGERIRGWSSGEPVAVGGRTVQGVDTRAMATGVHDPPIWMAERWE